MDSLTQSPDWKKEFRLIVERLAKAGISGAHQQVTLAALWEFGPMTASEIKAKLNYPTRVNLRLDHLRNKGAIYVHRTISTNDPETKWNLTSRTAQAFTPKRG